KSVKKSRWHYEHFANDYGAACLQFSDYYINDRYSKASMENQSENCLFLNVFSPYDPEDEGKLYPVLVWIHGGSFLAGSGDTGIDMEVTVENIVFKNVSLVTFNYRLGPLGFMSYENGDFTDGNFGIWDQVTALEWIQANMKQLNGDPFNVTVMGEDAGAAAASMLAVSPKTYNLIHRVITLSGSSTAGWAVQRHQTSAWDLRNLVDYLRCEKTFQKQTLEKLQLTDRTDEGRCNLQEKTLSCFNEIQDFNSDEVMHCVRNELNFSSLPFRLALAHELGISKMVVDGDLIPGSGKELIRQNARIPILIGITHKEWSRKEPKDYGFHRYQNVSGEERKRSVWRVIDEHYHAGSEMESDIDFVAPAQKEIEAYVSNGLPVHAFSFDYVSETPMFETVKKSYSLFGDKTLAVNRTLQPLVGLSMQAFHGISNAYVFTKGYKNNFQLQEFSEKDQNMSKMITRIITNFVKHGERKRSLHWPDTIFWNIEADLLEKFSFRGGHCPKETEDLSSEERLQLAAYRRAWWALWVLVALIGLSIWGCIIFIVVKKCRSPRAKPYDNIVFNR
ncbi:unnamed protein product, partial [Enterobius vermicularis]|uniref:COesterase domain-containing protein n=1 Tax=Enterobius vermicularis TaxID=51028 RepID=A0A158QAS6_ENTVE